MPRPGLRKRWGRLSPTRGMWLYSTIYGYVSIFKSRSGVEDEEELDASEQDEYGSDLHVVMLALRKEGMSRSRPFSISLTNLTELELDTFQKFVNDAITAARPTVQELDRRAKAAREAGDDAYRRLYRPVPTIQRRPWFAAQYDQGVPFGPPATAFDIHKPGRPRNDTPRDERSTLVEWTGEDAEPQDDPAEVGLGTSVGDVGGDGELPE